MRQPDYAVVTLGSRAFQLCAGGFHSTGTGTCGWRPPPPVCGGAGRRGLSLLEALGGWLAEGGPGARALRAGVWERGGASRGRVVLRAGPAGSPVRRWRPLLDVRSGERDVASRAPAQAVGPPSRDSGGLRAALGLGRVGMRPGRPPSVCVLCPHRGVPLCDPGVPRPRHGEAWGVRQGAAAVQGCSFCAPTPESLQGPVPQAAARLGQAQGVRLLDGV